MKFSECKRHHLPDPANTVLVFALTRALTRANVMTLGDWLRSDGPTEGRVTLRVTLLDGGEPDTGRVWLEAF